MRIRVPKRLIAAALILMALFAAVRIGTSSYENAVRARQTQTP